MVSVRRAETPEPVPDPTGYIVPGIIQTQVPWLVGKEKVKEYKNRPTDVKAFMCEAVKNSPHLFGYGMDSNRLPNELRQRRREVRHESGLDHAHEVMQPGFYEHLPPQDVRTTRRMVQGRSHGTQGGDLLAHPGTPLLVEPGCTAPGGSAPAAASSARPAAGGPSSGAAPLAAEVPRLAAGSGELPLPVMQRWQLERSDALEVSASPRPQQKPSQSQRRGRPHRRHHGSSKPQPGATKEPGRLAPAAARGPESRRQAATPTPGATARPLPLDSWRQAASTPTPQLQLREELLLSRAGQATPPEAVTAPPSVLFSTSDCRGFEVAMLAEPPPKGGASPRLGAAAAASPRKGKVKTLGASKVPLRAETPLWRLAQADAQQAASRPGAVRRFRGGRGTQEARPPGEEAVVGEALAAPSAALGGRASPTGAAVLAGSGGGRCGRPTQAWA